MTVRDTSEIRVWYVAQTKPRQEHIAELNLARQRYEVLLPLIPRLRNSKTRLIEKEEPLFPGYIFFRPEHSQHSLSPARSTTGIARLVRFGIEYARLRESAMNEIMSFVQTQLSDPVEATRRAKRLDIGAQVRITGGPMVGLEGLVSRVASDRIIVLIEIMGREQKIAMSPATLERA
ncbi:MAG: transcription termination/antitermination protein NusG [Burkholderiaceae bacterium]